MLPDRPDPDDTATDQAPEIDPALAAAHRAVLEREERRRADRRSGLDRRLRAPAAVDQTWFAAAAAGWLVVFLVLLTPPAFLRPPAPAPYRPPEGALEASLRYGLWLADHRVGDFVAREGRLPSFLAESGSGDPAITMEVTGERSYRLVGRAGELELVLTDRMAADSFLGSSLAVLRPE